VVTWVAALLFSGATGSSEYNPKLQRPGGYLHSVSLGHLGLHSHITYELLLSAVEPRSNIFICLEDLLLTFDCCYLLSVSTYGYEFI
jgi:hypothetical protein